MGGMSALTGLAGKIDPLTGRVNSLLGMDAPAAAPAAAATAAVTAQPAAAAPVGQPTGATSKIRPKAGGARAGSILTVNIDDNKLGG